MNAERFVEFLAALIKRKRKPVFVIVDNHPAHRGKVVREFVASHPKRLELYFLPPYSPRLNPEEQVWNHLKNHTVGKRGFLIAELMRRLVEQHMDRPSEAKGLIRSFFAERHCRYILET